MTTLTQLPTPPLESKAAALLLTAVELKFSKIIYNSISLFREQIIQNPAKIDLNKAETSASGIYLNSLLNFTHEQFWALVCSNKVFHDVWSALNFVEKTWWASAVVRFYHLEKEIELVQQIHRDFEPHEAFFEERYNTQPWYVRGKGWGNECLPGRYGIFIDDLRAAMRFVQRCEERYQLTNPYREQPFM